MPPSQSISFDRAVTFYDQTRAFQPGEDIKVAAMIVQASGFTPSARVLEIGVGTGRIALPLAPRVGQLIGVDISTGMMNRLRQKQTGKTIYLAQADAVSLPFAERQFDGVVAVHVFHLVSDWRAALSEVRRVLKPGGVLVHGLGGRESIFEVMESVFKKHLPQQQTEGGLPRHYYTTFLEDSGWRPAGEKLTLEYAYEKTPQTYVDEIRGRIWSSTWQLSDEQIKACAGEMHDLLQARFHDMTKPIGITRSFDVRAYFPPSKTAL